MEETGLEKHQEKAKKKEETEVACGNNQSAESMRQEGPGTEESSSPDHSGGQVVTSEGGQEQIQREETQTRKEGKRCSHLPVNEGNERAGPGVASLRHYLHIFTCKLFKMKWQLIFKGDDTLLLYSNILYVGV